MEREEADNSISSEELIRRKTADMSSRGSRDAWMRTLNALRDAEPADFLDSEEEDSI